MFIQDSAAAKRALCGMVTLWNQTIITFTTKLQIGYFILLLTLQVRKCNNSKVLVTAIIAKSCYHDFYEYLMLIAGILSIVNLVIWLLVSCIAVDKSAAANPAFLL